MKWILCYLNPHDYVIYKSDITEASQSVQYYEFINYIRQYVIGDYKDFLENLNRYFTIFIDTENCKWKIYNKKHKEPSFEELYTLNEARENNKNKVENIELYKNTIENIFNKKYGRQNRDTSSRGKNIRTFFSRIK